jgi:type IV pilus assembly protein PilY1
VTVGGSIVFTQNTLLDVNQPFSAAPTVLRDYNNNYWVYAGTGRYFTLDDNTSTATQSYYGVKEPISSGVMTGASVAKTSLINTSDIQTFATGQIRSASTLTSPVTLSNGASASHFYDVLDEVSKTSGWYYNFSRSRSRNTTASVITDQSVIFSEYQPSNQKCQPEGESFLNAPHTLAGIPGFYGPLGKDATITMNSQSLVKLSVNIGLGSPSVPQIYQNSAGVRSVIVQTSTGQISWQTLTGSTLQGQRESWREIPITW